MKKSISLILVFALVIGVFAIVPLTPVANATSVDVLKFELNEDGKSYSVVGYNLTNETEIVIPSIYNDLPVTSIGNYAFFECIALTSVIIPDSIVTIGDYAFNDCVCLVSVTIGDGVTTIGEGAFYNCTVLTDIVIPDSVTSIGESVFYNCYDLSNVTIGNGVTSISNFMFAECMSLTSITIPDGVTSIGGAAFYECIKLTSITIPDKVTSIGEAAFYYCRDLISVTIPNSITDIHETAFAECSEELVFIVNNNDYAIDYLEKNNFNYILNSNNKDTLVFELSEDGLYYSVVRHNITTETEIVIPDTYNGLPVTQIADSAFISVESLVSVVIPDSITTIGWCAFEGCTSLTDLIIPETVIQIGEDAFTDCDNLVLGVYKESYAHNYAKRKGLIFKIISNESELDNLVFELNSDGNSYSVVNCTISNYNEDGDFAAPVKVVIPDEYKGLPVTKISSNAFSGREAIREVVIPDSVTIIESEAFNNCSYLTNITMSKNITQVGMWCFNKTEFYNTEENWVNDVLYCGNVLVEGKENISGAYTIKDGTKCIAESAFRFREGLTSVTIPCTVTDIGNTAFFGCDLSQIVLPEGVASIGNAVFGGNQKLTSITIPETLKNLGYDVLVNCSSLKYVFYAGSSENLENIGVLNAPPTAVVHYNSTGHSHSRSIETAPTEQESGKVIDTCPVCGFVNGEEKITYVNNYITAVDTKNAVVDTKSNILLIDISACKDINEAIIEMDGYKLTGTPNSAYDYYGTGSKIQVAGTNGTQAAEYTLVVRGDVNGDSMCDVLDCMLLELARNNHTTLTGVYFTAANLAEDNEINIDDFKAVVNKAVA